MALNLSGKSRFDKLGDFYFIDLLKFEFQVKNHEAFRVELDLTVVRCLFSKSSHTINNTI